jgi:hypothetical protein
MNGLRLEHQVGEGQGVKRFGFGSGPLPARPGRALIASSMRGGIAFITRTSLLNSTCGPEFHQKDGDLVSETTIAWRGQAR